MSLSRDCTPWPGDRIVQLRALWDAGYSTLRIGLIMGISKSAVIGKAHRLRLAPRPSPIKPRDGRAPRKERTVPNGHARGTHSLPIGAGFLADMALSELPLMPACEPEPRPQTPVDTFRTCQWIEADPRVDATMCGQPAQIGSSYCPAHHERCWIRVPIRAVTVSEIGLPDPVRDGRADAQVGRSSL